MQYILDSLIAALKQGESVVLGTIVRSSGSAPRGSGAKMMIRSTGTLSGTLGGGALEGRCLAEGKRLLDSSCTEHFAEIHTNLTNTTAAAEGMVCGGDVSVLLQKVTPAQLPHFVKLRDSFRRGMSSVLVTVLPAEGKEPEVFFVHGLEDCGLPKELKDEILRKHRRVKFLISFEGRDYFVEPLIHSGTVYIVGAGHVALSTAHLAAFTDFDVVVMDDREEFANSERFPDAKEVIVLDNFTECLQELRSDDYVVIVTRGHLYDRDVLAQALRTEAGYIGMIGSSKKRQEVYTSLMEEGFTNNDLQRVYSPIGISIGGDTPEEIGLSIVAELIKVRAGMKV